ncbi:two-component system sensor histidine kinase KdpD [Longimicrobium terrae]|uniref:Two-component system sensor histidine kinase KdpD n=2 Tax=Longimicrobium terrae TaxID=1639882 RepID=A0A841H1P2_9BACT|nr:universal stress protein [Longimicrobium terrae]MBB6071937.1 two-component system sensor histidine kinase KdpD [Longimicrobium terrae]
MQESTSPFRDPERPAGPGVFKLYMGSFAGVGKTYRMLQEAHELRARGVDVVAGFVETHGRAETAALAEGLEVIPRRRVEYRGVVLEEMDVDSVLARRPRVALVDELAHTNVPGSRNARRWRDVMELLDAGISVISALNVQHLESLTRTVAETLGVTVRETVPDWVVARADQVVNIDIPAEELRQRLMDGKVYAAERIPAALANFFTPQNLTTLRELALREVASSVDRLRTGIVSRDEGAPRSADRVLVAMSSRPPHTDVLLQKATRLAGRLNTDWYCVYVQTPDEAADRIDAAVQRQLVQNIQTAQRMGAEIVKLQGADVAQAIIRFAREKGVAMIIVGQTHRSRLHRALRGSVIERLIGAAGIDVLVVSLADEAGR